MIRKLLNALDLLPQWVTMLIAAAFFIVGSLMVLVAANSLLRGCAHG